MKLVRIFFFEFEFFENWLWSDFWRPTIGVQAKMHRKSLKILENSSKIDFSGLVRPVKVVRLEVSVHLRGR